MSAAPWSRRPATAVVIGLLGLLLGMTAVVGADFLWLVALGDDILDHGRVPVGIPFAAAPTDGWPNVLVLAEIGLALLWRVGPTGALVFAVVIAVGTVSVLARAGVRRGAGDSAVAVVVVLVTAGSITAWGVVRLQTLSLVPFAVLCLILQAEADRASRRIWVVPPLLALWGNLHGAVLVGLCLVGVYLLFSRLPRDPATGVAVGIACVAALFANPAGLRTVDYYRGVLGNAAAASESHLWAAIDLGSGADRALVVGIVILLVAAARRLMLWEGVAIVGLAVGTGVAARNGIWLLFLLSAPAAVGLTKGFARLTEARAGRGFEASETAGGQGGSGRKSARPAWSLFAVALFIVGTAAAATRPRPIAQVDSADVAAITAIAGSRVVLAPEPLVEALAVAGVRVWVADPLDAFSNGDQQAYLAFLDGSPNWTVAARPVVEIVVVARGSAEQAQLDGLGLVPVTAADLPEEWLLYRWP